MAGTSSSPDFMALPVGLLDLGPDGEILDSNQALADLLGFAGPKDLAERTGGHARSLFADPAGLSALLRNVDASGEASDFESDLFARHGGRVHAALWAVRQADDPGRIRAVVVDVSRRKRLESELKMFDFIVNTSRDFMSLIGSDLRYKAVNATYVEQFHKSREELIGSTLAEVWGEDVFVNVIWPNLARCFQGYEIHYGAWFTFHRKGRGYYDISYYPFYGRPGEVTHAVIITRDITERKKLHDAWRKFQFIADASKDFMTLIDREHRYEAVNRSYLRMFGHKLEDILGRSVAEVWGREKYEANILPRLEECLQGMTVGYAAWFDFHDQGKGYYDVVFYPYRDEGGEVTHAVVVSRDITEYKVAEEALRESEERYRAVLDGSAQGILVSDADGRVRYANPAMRAFLELPPMQEAELTLADIHPDGPPGPERGLARDVACLTRSGKKVFADVSLARTAIHGRPCLVGFYLDAGERISREKAMRQREAAEAAARAKTEFFAGLSHELRTPLNSILGMAELLAESELDPDQRRYVDILSATGASLMGLVNEILDLTKVESGHLVLENTDFDPVAVLEKACLAMAPQAHNKDLELVCSTAPDVPRRLRGDPTRLGQVLTNLIGNAVKFTRQGFVQVRAEPRPGPGEGVTLAFTVRDTGVGVPPDKHESIFESFTQAEESTTRRYGGTGLGLAICKRLVDMMGGSISLDSAPGKGSAFTFTAVFSPALAPDASAPEPDLRGVAALVADACGPGREAVAEILAAWGADVRICLSEPEALKAHEASRAKAWLAVLAQPLQGPDPLAEALSGAGADMGRVIESVGLGTSLGRDRGRLPGRGPVVARPASRAELAGAVEKALGRAPEAEAPAEPEPAPEPEPRETNVPLRILLAEDNENNRMLFEFYLKAASCSVAWAGNGRQAVSLFADNEFDLVFLDLEMPVMNGLEAVAEMRGLEAGRNRARTPVVALSSHSDQATVDKSLKAGCDAYLAKPVKRSDLLAMIDKMAGSREG